MRGTMTVATMLAAMVATQAASAQVAGGLNVTTIGSAGVAAGAVAGTAALTGALATAIREPVAMHPSYLQVADQALLPPVTKLIAPDSGNLSVARLRPGFGNSMTSFYPLSGEGLHFSAGSKLYGRMAAAPADLPDRMRFLLGSGPRLSGPRSTRQFAPAALLGYDRSLAHGLVVGVDGGMVMGRLSPAAYVVGRGPGAGRGLGGFASNQRLGSRSQGNAVARMTMSYRF